MSLLPSAGSVSEFGLVLMGEMVDSGLAGQGLRSRRVAVEQSPLPPLLSYQTLMELPRRRQMEHSKESSDGETESDSDERLGLGRVKEERSLEGRVYWRRLAEPARRRRGVVDLHLVSLATSRLALQVQGDPSLGIPGRPWTEQPRE